MLKIHHNATKFQEEYQRQRTQLEENYESYRHIFESQSSSAAAAADHDVDEEDGGLNPFDDATEDEIASIESVLDTLEPSPGVVMADESQIHTSTGEDAEELERQTIRVGSADFDEYDASGKNPFF